MLAAGQTVDRWVLEAPVGEGGMAVVWRVRHASLGTRHALKVLTVGHSEIRERFLHEGRVQATLRHPNIVAVTDVTEADGMPALVLELVDGPSLATKLLEGRPPVDVAVAWFREIVAAVASAHARGLVHRDLKP